MAISSTAPAGTTTMTNTILSSMDILKPAKMAEVFLPYNNQGKDYIMIRNMGFEYPVANESYSHWEKGKAYVKTTLDEQTVTASSGVYTYDIDGFSSGDTIYPRVGEIYMFSTTYKKQGIVSGVDTSAGTVSLRPWSSTTLPTTISATATQSTTVARQDIIPITNSAGEESSVIAAAVTYFDEYSNHLKMTKDKIAASGTALSDDLWVNSSYGSWNYQMRDGERRMMQALNGDFWHGVANDDIQAVVDPNSESNANYQSTEGLFSAITDRGNTDIMSTSSFVVSEFNTTSSLLEAQYVSPNVPVMFKMGKTLSNAIEDGLVSAFGSSTQEYLRKGVNDMLYKKDVSALNIGFSYVQKSSHTFMLETNYAWTDPEVEGATGFDFDDVGVMIPLGKGRDGKTGKKFGNIGLRYKALGSFNRKMRVGKMSGFGANFDGEPITSETDASKYLWFAHFGNQFMNVNQMVLINY